MKELLLGKNKIDKIINNLTKTVYLKKSNIKSTLTN